MSHESMQTALWGPVSYFKENVLKALLGGSSGLCRLGYFAGALAHGRRPTVACPGALLPSLIRPSPYSY